VAVFIGKEVGRNRAKIEECIFHMRIKVIGGSEGICGELEESSGQFRLKYPFVQYLPQVTTGGS
jgi:hypothetical protein